MANTYTIKPGETLPAVAKRYNTTVNAITQANNISNPNQIYAGGALKIPTIATTPAAITIPTVGGQAKANAQAPAPAPTPAPTPAPAQTSVAAKPPALTDWAGKNGIQVAYNNGKVVMTNPSTGQQVSFLSNQGENYGIGDMVNNRHTVTNVEALRTALGMGETTNNGSQEQIDSLISMLQSLGQSQTPSFPVMDYNQARTQAGNELNPDYDAAKRELMRLTDVDLEKRGIYNAPLASGIVTEKSADFESGRQSAINKRAGEIVQQDQENSFQRQQLYLQDRAQRTDALASLLGTLSNRQLSTAEMTGILNGVKTIAAQQLEADKAFKEADLTGYYKNKPTLDREEFNLEKYKTNFSSAVSRLESLGYVSNDADAKILGVARGTQSFQARDAIAERQAAMARLDKQLSAEASIAAADRQAANARARADSALANFNKDLAVWELTGKAPNTPAMKAYGIAPGSAWVPNANDQMNQIQLEDAKKKSNQSKIDKLVDGYAGSLLSVKEKDGYDAATCEAIATIIINNPTKAGALNAYNSYRSALSKEGVDVGKVKSSLEEAFKLGDNFISNQIYDMKRSIGAE
jgi:murein DD-endopeptidase MepM/ murein hydrolase activator NlpD